MNDPIGDLLAPRPLGRTGILVPGIGIGGSPLGSSASLYGHGTAEDQGVATVTRVLSGPLGFLDTSNAYSAGESERRIGQAIASYGGLPDGFVLATKVDADPDTGRFDGDRVRRSFEESLSRLGVDRVPLLHLHDPEGFISVEEASAPNGAIEALLQLKSEGAVDAIGVAGGQVSEMRKYVETGAFDVLLTHNRFTLVDRSAQRLIELASERGLGVINAAAFGGGILARTPRSGDKYAYGMGTEQQVRAASLMAAACDRYGVPIAAAALQFAASLPGIDSVLVGASRPERVDETIRLATLDIPAELIEELDALTPGSDFWIQD
ncbi:aldo/keto reductase [Herbiconiux ginsengi]|uniref:D-threo-aldose 1-dehydrogenase n=1 Tax=Herbiconiux ginsengi TaxID=381665 RepID=A0A1H3LLQ7_9MICO|nr:aldo/keto reductase [Herbiconiux ginsengi]SDY64904.1 D-threo-aldose 1-dehydrogenase [Herbiconiux ginsengi]